MRDAQAQAGAAVAPRGAGVGLGEGGEQPGQRVLIHADAVVGDAEVQHRLLYAALDQARTHGNPTRSPRSAAELDRVAGQVEQHLAQPRRVAQQLRGNQRVGEQRQGHILLGGQMVQRVAHPFHHGLRVHGFAVDLEMTGLDLGEVEHVVDDRQQRVGRLAHRLDDLHLRVLEVALLEHVDHAHHAVHRRADLVAHRRQKGGLGTVGLLGVIACSQQLDGTHRDLALQLVAVPLQHGCRALALGDVLYVRDRHPAFGRVEDAQLDLCRKDAAVKPLDLDVLGSVVHRAGNMGFDETPEQGLISVSVVIGEQDSQRPAEEGLCLPAEQAFTSAAAHANRAVPVNQEDGTRRAVEQVAEFLRFALAHQLGADTRGQ